MRTDVGHVREINEDTVALLELKGAALAIVADGMGGHLAGDVASQMAVELLSERIRKMKEGIAADEAAEYLMASVQVANRTVYERAKQEARFHGMGTTLVCLLLAENWGWLCHVGDSRGYRLRDGVLTQLTKDHTLVNELVRSGQISVEEAEHHPQRNVLLRALGTDQQIDMDLEPVHPQQGDLFLLCSDGLTTSLSLPELREILSSSKPLSQKADDLMAAALSHGGGDNISLILLANSPLAVETS